MASKILLIDDEELVIKSVNKLLRKEGYEVLTADNGQEAIRLAQTHEISLIICDIRMPGLNGIETIKKIRTLFEQKNRRQVREILITGYADEATDRETEKLLVADYLYKPFDLRDFLVCVKKHINPQ